MNNYEKNYSEQSFWDKLKKHSVDAGKKVIYSALLGFYAIENPRVPLKEKLKIYGALGYLILPLDLVPDYIPVAGYGDDLAALLLALGTISSYIDEETKHKAKVKMEQWFGTIDSFDPDIIDIEGHIIEVEKGIGKAAAEGKKTEVTETFEQVAASSEQHEDFYHHMRDKIRKWMASEEGKSNKFAEYLLFAPDLFHLLCKLSLDPNIPAKEKAKLAGAIAYFVSPIDLIPEAVAGPIGFADDIAVASYVLDRIINHTDQSIVQKHWAGEGDVLAVIQKIIGDADEMIGQGLWKKLKDRFK